MFLGFQRSRQSGAQASASSGIGILARFIFALLTAWNALAAAGAAEPVDLLLVLAADVSRSVDQPKFLLQREGYAAAISDLRVIDAVKSGPHQRIGLCFVEWSGFGAQKLLIDWSLIDGMEAARKFGDQLLELPRSFADRTSISGGIEFAAAQMEHAPYEASRRTIDVSGDGTNNAGRDIKLARDEVLGRGVVINGIVILSDRPVPWNAEHTNPPGGLQKYYQDNVVGGPGAFVMVAEDFNSFGRAIVKKLIAEIAVPARRGTGLRKADAAQAGGRMSIALPYSPALE